MKLFILFTLMMGSSQLFAESALSEKLSELGIKEFYCDVSGTFESDKKVVNYGSVVHVFADDKNEALKTCVNKINLMKIGTEEDVSFVGEVPGFGGRVLVKSVEIRDSHL